MNIIKFDKDVKYNFYLGFFGLFFFKSGFSSQLVEQSQSPSSFPHWSNALIMMIITLLFTYNSILEQRYDSI